MARRRRKYDTERGTNLAPAKRSRNGMLLVLALAVVSLAPFLLAPPLSQTLPNTDVATVGGCSPNLWHVLYRVRQSEARPRRMPALWDAFYSRAPVPLGPTEDSHRDNQLANTNTTALPLALAPLYLSFQLAQYVALANNSMANWSPSMLAAGQSYCSVSLGEDGTVTPPRRVPVEAVPELRDAERFCVHDHPHCAFRCVAAVALRCRIPDDLATAVLASTHPHEVPSLVASLHLASHLYRDDRQLDTTTVHWAHYPAVPVCSAALGGTEAVSADANYWLPHERAVVWDDDDGAVVANGLPYRPSHAAMREYCETATPERDAWVRQRTGRLFGTSDKKLQVATATNATFVPPVAREALPFVRNASFMAQAAAASLATGRTPLNLVSCHTFNGAEVNGRSPGFRGESWLTTWIALSMSFGIEHMIIYDYTGAPLDRALMRRVLQPFVDAGLVTYVPFHPMLPVAQRAMNPPHGRCCEVDHTRVWTHQVPSYHSCLERFGRLARWTAVFDPDELLEPVGGYSDLRDVLADVEAADELHGAVQLYQVVFGHVPPGVRAGPKKSDPPAPEDLAPLSYPTDREEAHRVAYTAGQHSLHSLTNASSFGLTAGHFPSVLIHRQNFRDEDNALRADGGLTDRRFQQKTIYRSSRAVTPEVHQPCWLAGGFNTTAPYLDERTQARMDHFRFHSASSFGRARERDERLAHLDECVAAFATTKGRLLQDPESFTRLCIVPRAESAAEGGGGAFDREQARDGAKAMLQRLRGDL